MDTTQISDLQSVNTTDIRFRLGAILVELEKKKKPILLISRSKPKAWLYPYEKSVDADELFAKWQKLITSKYQKIKAKELIKLVRQNRDSR